MRFQPKSEEEIAAANLLLGGEYRFEVAEAAEQTSKAGNDMMKLRLNVYDEEERQHGIFDYLVGTDGAAYKLRHFAEAVGLLPQYERGELTADHAIGCTGMCVVGIQKDKTGQYPDKNVVRDYKPRAATPTNGAAKPASIQRAPIDDDIPF